MINFPNTNLKIGQNGEISLKKVVTKEKGANRFETTTKTLDMPSQAVEQWIDAVLKVEESEFTLADLAEGDPVKQITLEKSQANASKLSVKEEYPGVGKVMKIKESQGASVKYGLDYNTLTRNGLSQSSAQRL